MSSSTSSIQPQHYNGETIRQAFLPKVISPPGGPTCHPPGSPSHQKLQERLQPLPSGSLMMQQKYIKTVPSHHFMVPMIDSNIDLGNSSKLIMDNKDCEMLSTKQLEDNDTDSLFLKNLILENQKKDTIIKEQQETIKRLYESKSDEEKSSLLGKEIGRGEPSSGSPSSSCSVSGSAGVQSLSFCSSQDLENLHSELVNLHKIADTLKDIVVEQNKKFKKLGLCAFVLPRMPSALNGGAPILPPKTAGRSVVSNGTTLQEKQVRLAEENNEAKAFPTHVQGEEKDKIKSHEMESCPGSSKGSISYQMVTPSNMEEISAYVRNIERNYYYNRDRSNVDAFPLSSPYNQAIRNDVSGNQVDSHMQENYSVRNWPGQNLVVNGSDNDSVTGRVVMSKIGAVSTPDLVAGIRGVNVSGGHHQAVENVEGIYVNDACPSGMRDLQHQQHQMNGSSSERSDKVASVSLAENLNVRGINNKGISPSTPPTILPRQVSKSEVIYRGEAFDSVNGPPTRNLSENIIRSPNHHPVERRMNAYPPYPWQIQQEIQTSGTASRNNSAHHMGNFTAECEAVMIPDGFSLPPTDFTNTTPRNIPTPPSNNGQTAPQSDRQCPMCGLTFNDVPMEEFQGHVVECFDNDNGPATLTVQNEASNLQLPMTDYNECPMCHERFPLSVSQTEFEYHVHRHFGEEPFEVVGQ